MALDQIEFSTIRVILKPSNSRNPLQSQSVPGTFELQEDPPKRQFAKFQLMLLSPPEVFLIMRDIANEIPADSLGLNLLGNILEEQ